MDLRESSFILSCVIFIQCHVLMCWYQLQGEFVWVEFEFELIEFHLLEIQGEFLVKGSFYFSYCFLWFCCQRGRYSCIYIGWFRRLQIVMFAWWLMRWWLPIVVANVWWSWWLLTTSKEEIVVSNGVCVIVVGTNVVAVLLAPMKFDKDLKGFWKVELPIDDG